MIGRIVSFTHIMLLFVVSGKAQNDFFHITTEDGLLSNNIRSIAQDHQGFIWIGTEEGLHRYDGTTVVPYLNDETDSLSITSNFVLALFEDSRKNLWVGTLDGGLLLYDRNRDSFRRIDYPLDSGRTIGPGITSITEDGNGNLLVSNEDGMTFYFKVPSGKGPPLIHQLPFPEEIREKSNYNGETPAALDKSGHLWIGFDDFGICRIDLSSPKVFDNNRFLFEGVSLSVQVDSKDRVWVGTWEHGVYVFDMKSGRKAHYYAGSKINPILNNLISAIREDHDGNIWIGTDDGVNIFQSSGDPFSDPHIISLKHDDEDNRSLRANPVKCITLDKDGRVWVGSYFGGVNVYDKHAARFKTIRKRLSSQGLVHNNVSCFVKDDRGALWIGTDGGGVNVVAGGIRNITSPSLERHKLLNSVKGTEETKVKCIEKDDTGNIWIGTWGGGMFKVNADRSVTEHFTAQSKIALPCNEILALKSDGEQQLWVGTFGAGVFSFNPKTHDIKRYRFLPKYNTLPGFEKILAIHKDKQGNIWVARENGGLSKFNRRTDEFEVFNDSILTHDLTIQAIYEDRDGILWLGSNRNGLIMLDPSSRKTQRFDDRNGLANNTIHAITEDRRGSLWVSSNRGISQFSKRDKVFRNFTKKQGLQGNQFNNNSCFRDEGLLLFGGTEGINLFNPEEITTYTPLPSLAFTNFYVDNVSFNVRNGEMKKNIIVADSVHLNHTQNSFSVEFSLIDFNFSAEHQYAFFLEDFNKQWQYIGKERKATFTNLQPGDYTLKVMYASHEGTWIPAGKHLHIIIEPAFWQTLWFKTALIIFVPGLFMLLIYLRISFLREQKKNLATIVDQRTAELKEKNRELGSMLREISQQNEELHRNRLEIAKMNQEIKTQNEELKSQNDQINLQREELEVAQEKLKYTNDQLEKLIDERTKKLRATIRQLDKTVFELDRFVYSASHDLSAPLKSILGLLHLAKSERDLNRLQEYHHYMEESINKLEIVIQSLVDYSRNAHMELQPETVNVRTLINDVVQELIFLPEAKSKVFHNNVDNDVIVVSDVNRLKLVFQNIINNAIKYSDGNKSENFISITCERFRNKIKVMITDNGIGIEKNSIPKIFSMYFRATEKSKGSGLGLFIVKETVTKLQGRITVISEPNIGSTFTITLPVAVKEAPPSEEIAPSVSNDSTH
jgi:ligand-binding sensor domain-containing protein/signal transduction histidine kinase